jgi:hypothetical protein
LKIKTKDKTIDKTDRSNSKSKNQLNRNNKNFNKNLQKEKVIKVITTLMREQSEKIPNYTTTSFLCFIRKKQNQ